MEYKKSMIILILTIFLFSIASVCASDVNDAAIVSEDTNQIEISSNNGIANDNLQTSEKNSILTQTNDNGTLIAETNSQTLSEGEDTYYDLITEIGDGGDKNLNKSYYSYTGGDTIEIKNSGIINGNGAIIDMFGSSIQAFNVTASGVTFKNLTIKNSNYNGDGGAIYFSSSGTIENCNFINNTASKRGGAVFCNGECNVTDSNFINNNVSSGHGGAVWSMAANVGNCNFTDNSAF